MGTPQWNGDNAKDAPIILIRTPNNAERPVSSNNPVYGSATAEGLLEVSVGPLADVDKDNATGNQKVLAPAFADGTLVGRRRGP